MHVILNEAYIIWTVGIDTSICIRFSTWFIYSGVISGPIMKSVMLNHCSVASRRFRSSSSFSSVAKQEHCLLVCSGGSSVNFRWLSQWVLSLKHLFSVGKFMVDTIRYNNKWMCAWYNNLRYSNVAFLYQFFIWLKQKLFVLGCDLGINRFYYLRVGREPKIDYYG